ncbi:MAG: TlpA family protein disulfide reductase [Anaerolineae bacterium]
MNEAGRAKQRWLPLLLVTPVTAGVILLMAIGALTVIRSLRGDSAAASAEVGGRAPDIAVQDLQGKTVHLSDFRGQTVLLNFRTTWCGYCRAEAPELQAAHESIDELTILGVNINESAEIVSRYMDELGLTFAMFLDDGNAANTYGVNGIPASFFIGSDGRIFARTVGPLSLSRIRAYLAEHESGQ